MKQEVLSNFEWIYLSIFALLLFLTLFIGVAAWVVRKGSNKTYAEASMLPFEKGELK